MITCSRSRNSSRLAVKIRKQLWNQNGLHGAGILLFDGAVVTDLMVDLFKTTPGLKTKCTVSKTVSHCITLMVLITCPLSHWFYFGNLKYIFAYPTLSQHRHTTDTTRNSNVIITSKRCLKVVDTQRTQGAIITSLLRWETTFERRFDVVMALLLCRVAAVLGQLDLFSM